MTLFRPVRGELSQALRLVEPCETLVQLRAILARDGHRLAAVQYAGLDKRCGWDTWVVLALNPYVCPTAFVAGYVDGHPATAHLLEFECN